MQKYKYQVELDKSDNWKDNFVADIENKVNALTSISRITGVISIISFFMVILNFPERSHTESSTYLSVFLMETSILVGFTASLIGVIFGLRALYKSDDLNHLDNTKINKGDIFLALALNLTPLAIFLLGISFIAIVLSNLC